jgi:hypothetical protein
MQLQHEAVMSRDPSAQRRLQFRRGGMDAPVSQGRQSLWIGLAGDQGLDHAPAGETNDVGYDRIELDVGILQRFLNALRVAAALAHELLAGAQQIARLLDRLTVSKLMVLTILASKSPFGQRFEPRAVRLLKELRSLRK